MPDPFQVSDPIANQVLAGGGEMGALMRAKDWGATPVGPVEAWPQSLRTALSILLDSRYPMYIAWGPDFVQFYNDAYRPILGSTKHPMGLGQSTRECFHEIWDFIGPMFDRVLADGEATYLEDQLLPLDRNGYVEECYFTFCYSAIRRESGGAGGVFVTCIETTERVIGERRLRTLRDLGAAALEAKTPESACEAAAAILGANRFDIPFAMLYLVDDDRRSARRVGLSGLDAGHEVAPSSINLTAARGPAHWAVAAVREGLDRVTEVGVPTAPSPLDCGPWPEAPTQALALAIAQPGQSRGTGVLVVGINARRRLDREYRDFLHLVAGHVATAVANARAYEEERRRAEALAELDRAKTTFFSNVSHEFRTPLTLMLAPLEELVSREDLGEEDREALQVVHRNALRQLRLVNTLLDFSRIEAGRVQACYEPTDLASLTVDLASAFHSAAERAGLHLSVDAPTLSQPVYVDRDMWEKIVLNLVSNAFKHTFEGEVAVALRDRGTAVELSVRDTGVGIEAAELPHIFDRFHRARGSRARTHEGTGIGLALVQELVRLHGGDIRVESEVDVGTVIAVTLPTGSAHLPLDRVAAPGTGAPAAVAAAAFVEEALRWLPGVSSEPAGQDAVRGRSEASARTLGPRACAAPSGSVLIADDNADMREYLARLLQGEWDVRTVSDGVSALAASRAAPPDLVLSDVMMPGLDGFQLLRELRGDARTADIPVVLVSARAGEESRVEALEAGADDYIVKPFSARELTARVHATVKLARVRRDAAAERQRLIQTLERERGRLAEIYEHSPAFIGVLRGPDHVFERVNPQYAQLVGHRPLIGRPVREAFPEVEGQEYFELLDRVYRTGEPYTGSEYRVLLHREAGGPLEERYINFVYDPLRDEEGEVTGIFVHGVDVSELVLARTEAEAANQTKSDFMATISHELRTPLNAILGYVELLRLGIPEPIPDASTRQVERVGASARHLLQLIDELLTFTRVQAGREVIEPVRVEMDPLLEEIRAIAEPLADAKSLRFEVDAQRAPSALITDARKVRQILLNLVGNAIKFTREGRVALRVSAGHGRVAFRVRDTGPGISEENLGKIFEPFWQVESSRSRSAGGTGLGLAISQHLAGILGGELVVKSRLGEGSTFELRLPLENRGGEA